MISDGVRVDYTTPGWSRPTTRCVDCGYADTRRMCDPDPEFTLTTPCEEHR